MTRNSRNTVWMSVAHAAKSLCVVATYAYACMWLVPASAQIYDVTNLSLGGSSTSPRLVNANGQVSGTAFVPGRYLIPRVLRVEEHGGHRYRHARRFVHRLDGNECFGTGHRLCDASTGTKRNMRTPGAKRAAWWISRLAEVMALRTRSTVLDKSSVTRRSPTTAPSMHSCGRKWRHDGSSAARRMVERSSGH